MGNSKFLITVQEEMNKPEFALYFFWYVPKTSTPDKQPTMSESMCWHPPQNRVICKIQI